MSVERDPTFCNLCNIPLSSFAVATQHYAGLKHSKKERALRSLQMNNGPATHEAHLRSLQMNNGPATHEAHLRSLQMNNGPATHEAHLRSLQMNNGAATHEAHLRSLQMNNGPATHEAHSKSQAAVSESPNHHEREYFFDHTTWRGMCNVCNVELTSVKLKDQHLSGKSHKKNLLRWSASQVSTSTPPEMLQLHNVSEDHQRKATGSMLPVDSTQWLMCEVCDVKCNSAEHLENHKRGVPHSKMVSRMAAGQVFNATGSQELAGRAETIYRCFEKSQQSLIGQHVSSSTSPDVQRLHTPALLSSKSPVGSSDSPLQCTGSMLPMDSTQWLLCEVCDVKCNSAENLENHKRGAPHMKMLHRLVARQDSNATERAEISHQFSKRDQLGGSYHDAVSPTPPSAQLPTPPVLQSPNSHEGSSDFWCDVCKLQFNGPQPAAQHYQSAKHLQKLQLKESGGKRDAVFCDVCAIYVDTHEMLELHKNSDKHKRKAASSFLPVDSTQWYNCELCNVKCNSAEHLEKHKNGTAHSKMLGQMLAMQYPYGTENHEQNDRAEAVNQNTMRSQQRTSYPVASLSKCSAEQQVQSPVLQSSGTNEESSDTWCHICKLAFTGPWSAAEHYQSVKHKQKLQLKKNGGKPDAVFCEVCAIYVDTIPMLEVHNRSVKHQRKLAGPTPPVDRTQWHLCELCDVKCNSAELLESHKKGESHMKRLQQLLAKEDFPAPLNPGLDGEKEVLYQRNEESQQVASRLIPAQALEVVENNDLEKLSTCHYQTTPSSHRTELLVSSNARVTAPLMPSDGGASLVTCQVNHNVDRLEKNARESAIELDIVDPLLVSIKSIIKPDPLLNLSTEQEAMEASVKPGESQGRTQLSSPESFVDEYPEDERWDSSRTLVSEEVKVCSPRDSSESRLDSSKMLNKVNYKEVQTNLSKISENESIKGRLVEETKSPVNGSSSRSQLESIKASVSEEACRERSFESSERQNLEHGSYTKISRAMANLSINEASSLETVTEGLKRTSQEDDLTQIPSSPRDMLDSREELLSQHCGVASCSRPTRNETDDCKMSSNKLAAGFELNTDNQCTDDPETSLTPTDEPEASLTSTEENDIVTDCSNSVVATSAQASQTPLDPTPDGSVPPLVKDQQCDDPFQSLIHTFPRDYQVEVFEKVFATAGDSVLFLPTGTGKTIVTTMIVSHMLRNNPAHQVLILAAGLPVVFKYVEAMNREIGNLEIQRTDCAGIRRERKLIIAGMCTGLKSVCEEPIRAQDIMVTTPDHFNHLASSEQTAWQAFSLVILLDAETYLTDNQLEFLLERHHNSVPSDIRPKLVAFAGLPCDLCTGSQPGQFLKNLKQALGNCDVIGVGKEGKREMGTFLLSKKPDFTVSDRDKSEKNLRNVLNEYLVASYSHLAKKIGVIPCTEVEEEVSVLLSIVDNPDWAFDSMGDMEKSLLLHCGEVASSLSLLRNFGIGLALDALRDIFYEDTANVNPLLKQDFPFYQQVVKFISGMVGNSDTTDQCSGLLEQTRELTKSNGRENLVLLLVENPVVAAQFGKKMKESNEREGDKSHCIDFMVAVDSHESPASSGVIIATCARYLNGTVLRKCKLISVVNPRHAKHYLAQVRGHDINNNCAVKITCNDDDTISLLERFLEAEETLVKADDLEALISHTE